MTRRLLAVFLAVAVLTAGAHAADKDAEPKKKEDSYVKVEAKGKLQTGIMAIGGETTGIVLRTSAGSFELDLDARLRKQADKLNNKTVVVTGTLYTKPGVTRGPRTIVKVATLKETK
jgi:hypothetical protein